jgi:hypothetical protein
LFQNLEQSLSLCQNIAQQEIILPKKQVVAKIAADELILLLGAALSHLGV